MAYSMNWRPQLDEISEGEKPAASSTSKLGPIPGLLPPSRSAPHAATPPRKASGTQFSSSYNMNWRPKYDDEEDEVPEPSKPASASAVAASVRSRVQGQNLEQHDDGRSFRLNLLDDCPVVECLGSYAFACMQDGVACTLEQGTGVPSIGVSPTWTLHIHPSNSKLSHRQTTQLSQAVYCCLYAAISMNQNNGVRLKLLDSTVLGPSAQKAILNLGIPLDGSLPITPSFILQLYQQVEPHLLRPHFPYFAIQSFNGSRKPVAHPARPPPSTASPELVYSRYDSKMKAHFQLYGQTVARGTQYLTVVPPTAQNSSAGETAAEQPMQLQLTWALEDPVLETIASEISDYDRAIHLEGHDKLSWRQVTPNLTSICHYAFLTESRCLRLWATCSSKEECSVLMSNGWMAKTANATESKQQVELLYLTQKDFWTNIKSL